MKIQCFSAILSITLKNSCLESKVLEVSSLLTIFKDISDSGDLPEKCSSLQKVSQYMCSTQQFFTWIYWRNRY